MCVSLTSEIVAGKNTLAKFWVAPENSFVLSPYGTRSASMYETNPTEVTMQKCLYSHLRRSAERRFGN